MLAHGAAGLFSATAMEALDPALRDRWFKPTTAANGDEAWQADAALRKMVTFRPLNLVGEWPIRGPFQAIFCRNTVIYFDQDDQRRVWADLARVCAPGGVLYVGHSERISGTDRFRLEAATTYRRLEAQ
jgi:chemotaxis protein methyltransferase CheR